MLVHYLNVPSLEDSGKCSPLLCTVASRHDSMRWSRDDLLSQLKPMCKGDAHSNNIHSGEYDCFTCAVTQFTVLNGPALQDSSASRTWFNTFWRDREPNHSQGHTPASATPTRVTFLSDLRVMPPGVELCVSLVSSGMNIPHRCNNTKHRIISPKLPSSSCTPPPSELGEAGSDGTAGDAQLPHLQAQSSPASSPHPPM